jgi:glycerol-3-phosphate dehydrogenase subunit B
MRQMRRIMLDLLVIGAGLTGLTAALAAAEAGLRVRVVGKGLNALHWAAGTIDLLGYLPAGDASGDLPGDLPVAAPLDALDQLPAAHPLRRLDAAAIHAAQQRIQSWLTEAGLPYVGGENGANLRLPSPAGALRPTWLAPVAQAVARLDDPSPLRVVGFDRLRDFYPHLIAENLTRQGHPACADVLPFTMLTPRHDANTVQLAQALDDPAQVATLGMALRARVQPGERVVLPAICGFARHPAVMAELQEIVGLPIAEIPTLPPSVAGIRLHRALVARLQTLGVRVELNMAVTGFHTQPSAHGRGRTLTAVETAASARPLQHRAATYLLATGGILGGGIGSEPAGRLWETVFDLPLHTPPTHADWFRPHFLDPRGHPIFAGGVETNADWQPVDSTGAPLYTNLWAAGSILAHADPIRTRSREGLAVATALAATAAILAARSPS